MHAKSLFISLPLFAFLSAAQVSVDFGAIQQLDSDTYSACSSLQATFNQLASEFNTVVGSIGDKGGLNQAWSTFDGHASEFFSACQQLGSALDQVTSTYSSTDSSVSALLG